MAWRRQAAVVRCHGPRGGGEPWPSPHVPLGFGEAPLTSMAGLTAEPAGFDHAELHLAGSSLVGAGGPRSVLWGGMRGVERSAMAGSGRAPGPRGAYAGFRGAGEPRGVRCRFWMGESGGFCVAVAVRCGRETINKDERKQQRLIGYHTLFTAALSLVSRIQSYTIWNHDLIHAHCHVCTKFLV